MEVLRKYNAATTILFPLIDAGAQDFENTPVTFVAADTQISKDEGAFANTGSTPTHEGNGVYSLALTATEMSASRIIITIIDAATKEWEDQAIILSTYGNVSAQHAFDLDKSTQDVNVASMDANAVTASALATDAAEEIADTVWDEAKSGHVGAGSFGEEVQDHVLSSEITALNDPTAATIADAIWDEAKSGHVGAGSFGEEVQDHALSSEITALNDPTSAVIADAVWDEAKSGHVASGSFGEQCGTDIDAILTDTADMQPKLGTPAGADISVDIADIKSDTAATLVDTTEIGVAGAGLTDLGGMSTGMKGEVQTEVDNALDDTIVVRRNTAQAGAAGSITLDTGASAINDTYKGLLIHIVSGTGADQARLITAYDGTTKVATISPDWITNPNSTAVFRLLAAGSVLDVFTGILGTDDQVLISVDAQDLSGSLDVNTKTITANAIDATTIATGAIDADSIASDAITAAKIATDAIGADEFAQAAADKVFGSGGAAIAELSQGAPTATPNAGEATMLPYMSLRNKLDVDANFKEVHNDAGTVITKKALTDDGTTYSEAEMTSGP